MKLAEMKQRRADARKRAKSIMDAIAARGADASATDDESKALLGIHSEVEKLDRDIDLAEKMTALMGEDETETRSAKPGKEEPDTEGKETRSKKEPNVEVVVDKSKPVFRNFGENLQAIACLHRVGGDVEAQTRAHNMLKEVAKRSPSGLAAMNDTDGGLLIEPDKQAEIEKSKNDDMPTLADDCRQIVLSSNANSFIVNALNDNSRADGVRLGGVEAYWIGETEVPSATKPGIRQIEIPLNKIGAIGYATEELLADAAALSIVMRDGFRSAIRYQEGMAVFEGNGHKKPKGVMDASTKARLVIAKESGQAADTFVYKNALKMYSAMHPSLMMGAKWYINAEVWPEIISMVIATGSSSGQTVFLPPNGVHDAPYGLLFGRPVVPIEACNALGDEGDVLFANMSAYAMIKKGDVNEQESMHVRFLQGEMAFRVTKRVGGMPIPNDVWTPAKGTQKQAAFVTLAVRA